MHISLVRARGLVLGLTLASLGLIAGCSPNSKVEGTVKHKGQAVASAVVQFIDNDGMVVGSGQTDANGKYKLLTSYGKDQIPPGTYKVTVSKTSTAGDMVMDPHAKEAAGKADPNKDYLKGMLTSGKQKSQLPEQFAQVKSTTLSATVPGGPFDFDLGN